MFLSVDKSPACCSRTDFLLNVLKAERSGSIPACSEGRLSSLAASAAEPGGPNNSLITFCLDWEREEEEEEPEGEEWTEDEEEDDS